MSIAIPYAGRGSTMEGELPHAAVRGGTGGSSPARGSLQQVTDQARLSTLAPRIEAALREMAGPGGTLLTALSCNVEALQEGFVEALYDAFAEEKIDLSDKLTLRLDAKTLSVSGDHPQKKRIDALLARHADLSAAFGEIAAQSEILRDIGNITKVMNRQTGEDIPIPAFGKSAFAVYQMSLKGEMSHFYFAKA